MKAHKRLDESQPHARVYALPGGAYYEQNHRYYRFDGSLIDEAPADAPLDAVSTVTVSDEARMPSEQELRAQMEIYGESWRGTKHAMQVLEGKVA